MEKTVWLVILSGDNVRFMKYADQHRIFEEQEKALAWAVENGFEDPYHMGVSDTVGQMTFYQSGDVKVGIMKQLVR